MLNRDDRYTVYKHTAPSGKVYVGITSQDVNRRWQNGFGYFNNDYFTKAIKKYGWNSFTHDILDADLSLPEAIEKEKEYIASFRSNEREYGYNLSSGGESHSGCKFSEKTRQRMSASHLGHTYAMSDAHKKAISAALKGKKKSETHIQHLRGRTVSEESRKRLSSAMDSVKRAVVCVETGEVFSCAYDAKRKYGFHPSSINRACKLGRRAGGFHWEFFPEHSQANTEVNTETKESVSL